MVLLSYVARKLYKKELPSLDENPPPSQYVITTIASLVSEQNNNTSEANNNVTAKTFVANTVSDLKSGT